LQRENALVCERYSRHYTAQQPEHESAVEAFQGLSSVAEKFDKGPGSNTLDFPDLGDHFLDGLKIKFDWTEEEK